MKGKPKYQIEIDNKNYYNPPVKDFDAEFEFDTKDAVPWDVSLFSIENAEKNYDLLFNAVNDCKKINKNV